MYSSKSLLESPLVFRLFIISSLLLLSQLANADTKTTVFITAEKQDGALRVKYTLDKPVAHFSFLNTKNPNFSKLWQVQNEDMLLAGGAIKKLDQSTFTEFTITVMPETEGNLNNPWPTLSMGNNDLLVNSRDLLGDTKAFENTLCIIGSNETCADNNQAPAAFESRASGIIDTYSATNGAPIYIGNQPYSKEALDYRLMFAPTVPMWVQNTLQDATEKGLSFFGNHLSWETDVPFTLFANHYNKPDDDTFWAGWQTIDNMFIFRIKTDEPDTKYLYVQNKISEFMLQRMAYILAYEWFVNFTHKPNENRFYHGGIRYWILKAKETIATERTAPENKQTVIRLFGSKPNDSNINISITEADENGNEVEIEPLGWAKESNWLHENRQLITKTLDTCLKERALIVRAAETGSSKSPKETYECSFIYQWLTDQILIKHSDGAIDVTNLWKITRDNFTYSVTPFELFFEQVKLHDTDDQLIQQLYTAFTTPDRSYKKAIKNALKFIDEKELLKTAFNS